VKKVVHIQIPLKNLANITSYLSYLTHSLSNIGSFINHFGQATDHCNVHIVIQNLEAITCSLRSC